MVSGRDCVVVVQCSSSFYSCRPSGVHIRARVCLIVFYYFKRALMTRLTASIGNFKATTPSSLLLTFQ